MAIAARFARDLPRPRFTRLMWARTHAAPTGGRATWWLLVTLVVALNVVGLVMVLSASSVQALRIEGSSWYFFNRQVLWTVLGVIALLVAARVDYRFWRRWTTHLMVASLVLLVLVLVPGVGIEVSGSSRWLGFGALRMQPSELAKFAVLVFAADLLARRADKMGDNRLTLRPVLTGLGAIAVLLLLQPDLGTTLVTGAIVMAVLFVAGVPVGTMAAVVSVSAVLTLGLARSQPYRWRRMTAFLDPFADAGNTGYQAAQGLVALAAGGWTGVGLGESRAKWGFLPAAHTDFIFAIIGEELGFIGAVTVILLFAGVAAVGVRTAVTAPDRFGTLLAAGITTWVSMQAFVNLGAVVGLVPITGVPLPFVSAGGSSLIIGMATFGILLNISRQARVPKRRRPVAAEARA